uniref:D-isomer specific 2-hydroxyacid dehydrogenase NAD-binding domain-containing protein n=1 Tax=Tetradesmus obliquus TaxID=3088 RepID=A0A383VKK1_TETOB|eukprot:jgi/Sobl393_1/9350/SZX64896.1
MQSRGIGVNRSSSLLLPLRSPHRKIPFSSITSIRGSSRSSSRHAAMAAGKDSINLLVVANPATPELCVLQKLPPGVNIVATGQTLAELSQQLSDEQWGSIDVMLNCGVGKNAGKREDVQEFWGRLTGLQWLHSASAGLEHLLFPELIDSPVVLSNAKGVYSHSLAEYALTCCSWFAKDFPRLLAAKAARSWAPYDVEELRGKTLGVVGYGDIGRATAVLAKAFRMKVVALRRNTTLAEADKGVVEKIYAPDQITELMSVSDYVVASTPYTPATDKLVSAAAIAAMKPNGVFINVGRGKCVDEEALIDALQNKRIRGAGLDVFATEPLPADSALWGLPNVFMSPHNADRTKEFQFESMELFVQNVERYMSGQELMNVCDKRSGY